VPSPHQALGTRGEKAVCKHAHCPRCNRRRPFKPLTVNFVCVDIICAFCGFLAQVKATRLLSGTSSLPDRLPGSAWRPQHERMLAGIYHGLFVVGFRHDGRSLVCIDYVPPHILAATPSVFAPRRPLRPTAKRAGWTGFTFMLSELPAMGIWRIYPAS
jgi:type II restriction enzyme